MIKTNQWQILDKFTGLYTALDSDDLPYGKSPNLLNVRINGSNFQGSKGYSLIGSRDSNSGKITSLYTYNRNDGDQVMVRVKDNGSDGILEWYDTTNDEWYELLGSLTTGKTMGFTEFNSTSKNQMLCCNGVENMSVWNGAITRLTSAVADTDTTINVSDTSNFSATGTIIYNGKEIAYSAKTSTTFTVDSAHASSGADDGIAEAIDDSTYSSITKGNILLTAKNRLWIAGQPANPTNLDYSDEGDALTYTGGSNRTDSGIEKVLNIGGKITGLSEKDDNIVILGQDGGVLFNFVYPTSTTKAPLYIQVFQSPGQGCISAKSVFRVNNEVYFANDNGIQSLTNVIGTEKVGTKSLTRSILPNTKNYVFDEASTIYHNKEDIVMIACKSDDNQSANDMVIGLDFYQGLNIEEMGIVKFDYPVADWAILGDELYFGNSFSMNSFKAFDTYQNDGAPRTIRYVTQRINYNDPFQHKTARLVAVKGYIKDGTNIDVDVIYNAGFRGTISKTIESDGAYVSKNALNYIGAFQMGTNPIGASLNEVSDLKQFMVYLDIGVDYRWNDIQLSFESQTDGGTFLVSYVGIAPIEAGYESVDKFTI